MLNRTEIFVNPDPSRVLIRPFFPVDSARRVKIIARLLALSEDEIGLLLDQVIMDFSGRHQNTKTIFLERFEIVRSDLVTDLEISEARKIVIGSYFTHEYSLEAAALFNPSIVFHPDQSDLPEGSKRFILSLRAMGEGHISSITFRTGIIDGNNQISIKAATGFVTEPRLVEISYKRKLFARELSDLGYAGKFTMRILQSLRNEFSLYDLEESVANAQNQIGRTEVTQSISEAIINLAKSHYQVTFPAEQRMSERVIFPHSPNQSNGIEDARFVKFEEEGEITYFATYTAYDGANIYPQMLRTKDFLTFEMFPLSGEAVENKGMALFPRKIGGRYAMLSRQDGENLYLMYSDNFHFWRRKQIFLKPTYAWEYVQLGNCGSPIETEKGWLILTHGVGAMRKYSIGAVLLDLEDPTRVIGRLHEPLIKPTEDEREGYVPNVVYTCGALLHGRELIIPYAVSDYATRFATVPLDTLLAAMG